MEKNRQFFELFIKEENSQGSQYLLETASDERTSIAPLSRSMTSWLGEA